MTPFSKETIELVRDRHIELIPNIQEKIFEIKKEDPNFDDRMERKYAELMLLLQTHKIDVLHYYINYTFSDAPVEDKALLYVMLHMFHDMDKMFEDVLKTK